MGPFRKFSLTAVVFCVGVGLGLAWKWGWLPVELLSPETGVLEEPPSNPDTDHQDAATFFDQLARDTRAEAPEELHFEGLTEPPPQTAPLARPTVLMQRPTQAETTAIPPNRISPSPEAQPVTVVEKAVSPIRGAAYQTETVSGADLRPSPPADAVLEEIDHQLQAGEILAAHKALSRLYWQERNRREELQERIDETARRIFFAPQPHFIEPHVVQPGDRLEKIAAQYKLSWEYLARLNQITPQRIRAGQRLKLVRGPFGAVVELNDYCLTIHLQGYYVKRYPIGIGKDGSTPLGKFAVLNKVVNPQYTDPDGRVIDSDDPQNPLGERWIDLGNGYGIHGTIEPETIGQAASRGCLRLLDHDIIEVYDFLVVGSEVVIRP